MSERSDKERLATIEAELKHAKQGIRSNGDTGKELIEQFHHFERESVEARSALMNKMNEIEKQISDRLTASEIEVRTMKARVGTALAVIGFLFTAAGALLSSAAMRVGKWLFSLDG